MGHASVDDLKVGVVGLGYVGLPLAFAFAKTREVIGFDVKSERVADLRCGNDKTGELETGDLQSVDGLHFTDNADDLAECNFYIVTVPTPVDQANTPDLTALLSASRTLGEYLSPGDFVVYESTVFPGATEEICVPVLEAQSGLLCAYSDDASDTEHFFLLVIAQSA